jgi:hypothetical protein
MPFNFIAVLVASLASLLIGYVWYNPKVFGSIWMREAGLTEEELKKGSMVKIFGLTIIYSLLLAFWMPQLVIHQVGVIQSAGGNVNDPAYLEFMKVHGDAFRYFKHGALHGLMSGIAIALPITAINGLFERKSWKYIAIHAGYWMVVMAIMGAIVCGWK